MNENQLRTRAKRLGLMLRKDGHGGYLLADISTNTLAATGPMALEQVGLWLDDLEADDGE